MIIPLFIEDLTIPRWLACEIINSMGFYQLPIVDFYWHNLFIIYEMGREITILQRQGPPIP